MRKTVLSTVAVAATLALAGCSQQVTGVASGTGGGEPTTAPGGGTATGMFGDTSQMANAVTAGAGKSKTAKFSLVGAGVQGTGQMSFDPANPTMSVATKTPAGEDTEVRLVDHVLYIRLPDSVLKATKATKPWHKSTLPNDPTAKALSDSDPSKVMEKIAKAGRITKSEQTQLAGQSTAHYTVDMDLAKSADQLPPELASKLAGKSVHYPVEIWLNSDQLPVQVVSDTTPILAAMGAPTTGPGAGKATVTYTDWGRPVTITAPPADQVGEN